MSELTERAKAISQLTKLRFLASLSEKDFRDRVVRPLFRKKGFTDGRDVCGPEEHGKDAIFVKQDPFGVSDVYVVQTKKGKLNLSRKVTENFVEATTQLKTALFTTVTILPAKEKKQPTKVVLCISGKINEHARQHICEEVSSPNIVFMDADALIPEIDEIMPEFWFDIDSELLPYLRAFKKMIATQSQLFTRTELISADIVPPAVSNELFVPLRLHRMIMKPRTRSGRVEQVPIVEEFPVSSLLGKSHRLVLILGSAGWGKTTSLLRLCFLLTEKALNSTEQGTIPLFLRSQEIASKDHATILELCSEKTMEVSNSTKLAFSSAHLEQGNIAVFVDALDEVPDIKQQTLVIKRLFEFHNAYPKCHIILASRRYAFIDQIAELRSFVHYDLTPISYRQAEKVLKTFHKSRSLPLEKSSELLRRLQDVHGIELNPLLVTVFAATTDYSRSDIPANITELFKKFTELMLGRWDASKGLSFQYQAPLKDFILQKIAFEMHRRRVTSIPLSNFKNLARLELDKRGHRADFEQLTDEMLHRSGLFRIVEDKVEFRHLMLQEFFAGRGIPNIDSIVNYVFDDWWRRAIVFYFGEHPDNSDAFTSIKDAIPTKTPTEIYRALVTIGLALQSSYLIEVDKKLPLIGWIIKELSCIQIIYESSVVENSKYPLTNFLLYYMYARDSVANNILRDYLSDVIEICRDDNPDKLPEEIRKFWIIIGLIEIGELDSAESLIQKFYPSDPRLLLGIHLGCFLVQHTRVTNRHDKKIAEKICARISNSISSLRHQIVEEFKSELLEVRKDKIHAIEKCKDEIVDSK